MDQILLPSKIIIFFLIIMFPPTCLANKPPFDISSDASALVAFRDHFIANTILSHNWTSYGPNISSVANSICHWVGVTCGARHQRVVALDLSDMGLAGTIPSHFGNLSFLRVLDLNNNKFHGQLPQEMAGLHRLSFIDVSLNSLSGNILAWFGLLPQLKYLDIHNNSFTGPIPPFLSNASKLENLNIRSNLVSGTIPVELGNLHNLKHLNMSLNQLTSEIPRSIFNLTLLETFSVYSNGISGGLPEDMCTSLPKLRILDLGSNELEGHIQSSLQFCARLEILSLQYNKFHGPLTGALGNLTMLNLLYLGGNDLKDVGFNSLSGNIPAWFGLLPQLKYLDIHNNSFTRPIPPFLFNASKLENLDISSNSVNGMIPVELGNLHNLKYLDMSYNQLTGEIPRSIFNSTLLETFCLVSNGISGSLREDMCTSLSKLRKLGLGGNELEGHIQSSLQFCTRLEKLSLAYNNFHGPLTAALGNLTMLNVLLLGGNNLKGDIPSELASLVKLRRLGLERAGLGGSIPPSIFNNMTSLETLLLHHNSLSGSITNEIGNCTEINEIYMEYNQLTGQVPEHMGRLRKLEILELGANNLGGHVPANLFNITSLRVISIGVNHLTGHLPANIGSGLPNLQVLLLDANRFSGTIPDSISNCSGLTRLSLGYNQFTGSPPTTLGNLRLLNSLSIDRSNLRLNAKEFIASLNSCRHLRHLNIEYNQVNGPLPSSFGNLTSSLKFLEASNCGMIGKIPGDIGNMSNLRFLNLGSNQLVGSLPHTLHGLSNIEEMYVSNNNISGSIPDDLCHLLRLGALELHVNRFSGPLPDCLGNMTSLRNLNLRINELSGSIPASSWALRDILELDLSSNSFTGYLPQDIGTLRAATYIHISRNQLSGTLPSTIGSLQTLANFSLAHNKFEGSIPESFGKLLSMEQLDLSYNNLSGEIPKSLQTLSYLKILNLSFNQLIGEIPSTGPFKNLTYLSFVSNEALCGSPRFHVPQCQSDGSSKHLTKRRNVLLFVYALMGMTLLTLVVLAAIYVMLKCRKKHQIPTVEDMPRGASHERISYHELLRATNSFDESNLLGKGSFGSVYKGVFANGRILAVKVFHVQAERAMRSFDTECEMLRNIRHRNLTKVISRCTNLDFMALVLEYMPNGSLEKWLYSHNYVLNAEQRLDIMIDVASALEYLHIGYSVPVVHCDLKPGNVLLDEDMVAHVSDFGISKFLKEEGGIVQTNTLATVGYTAPEYGREGVVSTKCDVYSFGIMLMEVFTRRRPTEEMFSGDLDLKFWVNQSLPDRVMEIIDENLLRKEEHQDSAMVQCVSLILDVASNCSSHLPDERMDMKDVLSSLKKIKLSLYANLA